MLIVPVVFLGGFAVLVASFFAGYQCTYYLVSFIKSIIYNKSNGEITKREHEDGFTVGISIIFGIFSVIFAFYIFYKESRSDSGGAYVLLVVIGFIASVLSFLIPAITANERQSTLSGKGKAAKIIDIDLQAQNNKAAKKREYYYKRYSVTLKRYELLLSLMLSGWINFISRYVLTRKLLSEIYFASLMKLLEKYVRINQIKVIEPFIKARKSISERVLEFLVGVIEVEGVRIAILLEMMNDPITNTTLSPYIVYLYNNQLDNMIIYLTNTYDETASALIATLNAEKRISLLQMGTMITEIKKRNSYYHYLKSVIVQNNMH